MPPFQAASGRPLTIEKIEKVEGKLFESEQVLLDPAVHSSHPDAHVVSVAGGGGATFTFTVTGLAPTTTAKRHVYFCIPAGSRLLPLGHDDTPTPLHDPLSIWGRTAPLVNTV